MARKKNYWLKLQKNFLKRHDIKYIKSLPEGHKIALFYLELLLEGIDHDGRLRFNEYVPYDEEMLATVLGYDLNIVKISITTLTKLHLMEVLDDGTMYMTKLESMLGIGNGDDANLRKKLSRDRKKMTMSQNVTPLSRSVTLEKEKETDKESETNKELETDIEVVSTSSSNLKESNKEISEFLKTSFKRSVTKYEIEEFEKLINLHGVDEVEKATKEAALRSRFNVKYIGGILKNWKSASEQHTEREEVDLSNYRNWLED